MTVTAWEDRKFWEMHARYNSSDLVKQHRELCRTSPVDPYRLLQELATSTYWWLRLLEATLTEEDVDTSSLRYRAYERAVTRAAQVAKLCGDLGVAERHVQLSELQGATNYRLLTDAFDLVPSITPEQRREWGAALRVAFERQAAERGAALPAAGQPAGRLPIRGATP